MAVKYPLIQHMSVSLHACVPVVSVIVKRTVFPPCAVDGCSRNPLYYYYYYSHAYAESTGDQI